MGGKGEAGGEMKLMQISLIKKFLWIESQQSAAQLRKTRNNYLHQELTYLLCIFVRRQNDS